jgi:hypothetical protein
VPLSATGLGYFPGWVGSVRRQPDGHLLVDWGTSGQITDVTRSGRVALRMRLGGWSYRVVRAPWTGLPDGNPLVAARRARDGVRVWASWNGATEIARWQVLAGDSPYALEPVGRAQRFADLETRLRVRTGARWVAVRAMAADGSFLGESGAVQPAQGPTPPTRSTAMRRRTPGGGSSIGGNRTSGPR